LSGVIGAVQVAEEMKEDIVKFIDAMKEEGFSREWVCDVLLIPSRRVRRWKDNFADSGDYQDRRRGPGVPHNRLNKNETDEIAAMAENEKYSGLSHRELAIRAQDEKRVFASKSSFYRVMKALGLIGKRQVRRSRKEKVAAPKIGDVADEPNRVWSWDFTYVWTGTEWIYLICILDVYSRRLMSWLVTRVMTDDVAIQLWEDTLHQYGLFDPAARPIPLWSFSDHGPQMTSADTTKFFKDMEIPMAYSRYRVPEDNAIHESFHKTLKHDKNMGYYYWKVASEEDLEGYMQNFAVYYNTNRTHSGIGDVTPDQMHRGLANDIQQKRRNSWKQAIAKREEKNKRTNKLRKITKEKRVA